MKHTSTILTVLGFVGFLLTMKTYNTYTDFYSGAALVLFIITMLYGIYIGEDKESEKENKRNN